jgi:hypothetical protein
MYGMVVDGVSSFVFVKVHVTSSSAARVTEMLGVVARRTKIHHEYVVG